MTIDDKNQNDIIKTQLEDSYNIEYTFNNKPLNRIITKLKVEDKSFLLDALKDKISKVNNCDLKNNAEK